jgi:hypothetical protein
MTIRSALPLAVLAVTALLPWKASAQMMTFIHTGTSGSGTIGGNAFSDRPFTITATGNTPNRENGNRISSIAHDTASIEIDGVGLFTFVSRTRTFFNDDFDLVGFSRAYGHGSTDLYNGPASAALDGWDMLRSIGPVSGPTNLLQWNKALVIITSGGELIFDNARTTGSFQAVFVPAAVPEPGSVALFLTVGVTCLLALRPRR